MIRFVLETARTSLVPRESHIDEKFTQFTVVRDCCDHSTKPFLLYEEKVPAPSMRCLRKNRLICTPPAYGYVLKTNEQCLFLSSSPQKLLGGPFLYLPTNTLALIVSEKNETEIAEAPRFDQHFKPRFAPWSPNFTKINRCLYCRNWSGTFLNDRHANVQIDLFLFPKYTTILFFPLCDVY